MILLRQKKNIRYFKPDIYCKGPDYRYKKNSDANLEKEIALLKKNNGKFVSVKHKKRSSNKIIKSKDLDIISKDNLYLKHISYLRSKFKNHIVNNSLTKLSNNTSLILGELIIDIYNFLDVVGKSGKEPMLVYKSNRKKKISRRFSTNCKYLFNVF